jgi:hypothetical protein
MKLTATNKGPEIMIPRAKRIAASYRGLFTSNAATINDFVPSWLKLKAACALHVHREIKWAMWSTRDGKYAPGGEPEKKFQPNPFEELLTGSLRSDLELSRSVLVRGSLTSQPFRFQPFVVCMKRLLSAFVLGQRYFGIRLLECLSSLALGRGK